MPSHVPVAAYVVDIVPVHVSAGGVVHVTPVHLSTHAPFSHSWFVIAQSRSRGEYAHTPLPVELSQRTVRIEHVRDRAAHVAAGGAVHVVVAHGSFGATHAPDAHTWNVVGAIDAGLARTSSSLASLSASHVAAPYVTTVLPSHVAFGAAGHAIRHGSRVAVIAAREQRDTAKTSQPEVQHAPLYRKRQASAQLSPMPMSTSSGTLELVDAAPSRP